MCDETLTSKTLLPPYQQSHPSLNHHLENNEFDTSLRPALKAQLTPHLNAPSHIVRLSQAFHPDFQDTCIGNGGRRESNAGKDLGVAFAARFRRMYYYSERVHFCRHFFSIELGRSFEEGFQGGRGGTSGMGDMSTRLSGSALALRRPLPSEHFEMKDRVRCLTIAL